MYFVSRLNYMKYTASVKHPYCPPTFFNVSFSLGGDFGGDNMIRMSCDQDRREGAPLLVVIGGKTKNKLSSFTTELLLAKPPA